MKATVKYNTLFVTSKFDIATLKKVKKFRPEALVLTKGEGKEKTPICAIMVSGKDDISKNSITFAHDSATGEKVAVLSREIPASAKTAAEIRDWMRDEFGLTIVNCEKIENQIDAAMTEIEADEAAMNAAISIEGDAAETVEQ